MIKVIFTTKGNEQVAIEADAGKTLMDIAVENGIEGIYAECGGACACATCHVHMSPESMEKVGPANEHEQCMLEITVDQNEYSRLCCQVTLTEGMDEIQLTIADN